jgi:uncharacterized Zn-binding protein involved in type VI secretion
VASPFFHVGAQAMCPHAGQVTTISSNVRVLVGGQPVATLGDNFLIAGCAFTVPPGKPQPCLKVQWISPAMRVMVGGQPAILQSSQGLCLSPEQIPQGPPSVVVTQIKAMGT